MIDEYESLKIKLKEFYLSLNKKCTIFYDYVMKNIHTLWENKPEKLNEFLDSMSKVL